MVSLKGEKWETRKLRFLAKKGEAFIQVFFKGWNLVLEGFFRGA
jgi:hypothetical protein